MERLWRKNKETLFREFQSDPCGLGGEEAAKRLATYGENRLREGKRKGILQVFAEQFADLLVVILLIAAGISAMTGGLEGTVVISVVLSMNAIL